MSNVNNYAFAKYLDSFKTRILDPQVQRVADAEKIMHDNNYKWDSEDAKKAGQAKYDNYKAWLKFYDDFYKQGMELVKQHESLVNNMAKWYGKWRDDISNEGKQEVELMSSQADMLNEIFSEMFKELQPLNLEGVKPPAALNLK
jgi:poly-beta-hydroxyalkanoate depolymerase